MGRPHPRLGMRSSQWPPSRGSQALSWCCANVCAQELLERTSRSAALPRCRRRQLNQTRWEPSPQSEASSCLRCLVILDWSSRWPAATRKPTPTGRSQQDTQQAAATSNELAEGPPSETQSLVMRPDFFSVATRAHSKRASRTWPEPRRRHHEGPSKVGGHSRSRQVKSLPAANLFEVGTRPERWPARAVGPPERIPLHNLSSARPFCFRSFVFVCVWPPVSQPDSQLE